MKSKWKNKEEIPASWRGLEAGAEEKNGVRTAEKRVKRGWNGDTKSEVAAMRMEGFSVLYIRRVGCVCGVTGQNPTQSGSKSGVQNQSEPTHFLRLNLTQSGQK